MINKVINVIPNPDESLISICDSIIEGFDSLIYKIFVGFPLFINKKRQFRPDLLLITTYGVLFATRDEDYDDQAVLLENKLREESFLRNGRELSFSVVPIKYNEGGYDGLRRSFIAEFKPPHSISLETDKLRYIESTLTGMIKHESASKAVHLGQSLLLDAIAHLTREISVFDGDQYKSIEGRMGREITSIRGLAGCGKTIVLCKIAANIIIHNPDARVCYTYWTRSMFGQVRKQVKAFLLSAGCDDPEEYFSKLHVMGSWGGRGNPGLMYEISQTLNLPHLSLNDAQVLYGYKPFEEYAKKVLLDLQDKEAGLFDYILIDEAQDFTSDFLRLCRRVLKTGGQLIYAYDDFQVLNEYSLPSPNEIFGEDIQFEPLSLGTCYRTPPQTLVIAHAVAMGIHSKNGKVYQCLQNFSDWSAMGYIFEKGKGEAGEEVVISRPSPEVFDFLEDPNFNLECMKLFRCGEDEVDYDKLAGAILADLDEGLKPEDILIVDIDGRLLTSHYELLSRAMWRAQDDCSDRSALLYNAGDISPDKFRALDRITFSGVKRAKGNEAYKVYVLNAHMAMNTDYPITWRNRLFTAMTRSRLQTVLVVPANTPLTEDLENEINAVKRDNCKLIFKYPSPESIQKSIGRAEKEKKAMRASGQVNDSFKDVPEEFKVKIIRDLMKTLTEDQFKELIGDGPLANMKNG